MTGESCQGGNNLNSGLDTKAGCHGGGVWGEDAKDRGKAGCWRGGWDRMKDYR
jgi:hypothetical protein